MSEYRVAEAKEVLRQYAEPHSIIDNGNLYFAGTTLAEAYDAVVAERDELKRGLAETKDYLFETEKELGPLKIERDALLLLIGGLKKRIADMGGSID